MNDEMIECFDTVDGGKIIFGPGYTMEFGPDNSTARPIRDILIFHGFSGRERCILMRDIQQTMYALGEGLIGWNNTGIIEYGYGLDTKQKTIESITSQIEHCKRDILLLMNGDFDADTLIVRTKINDGLIFIGPNDGRLGFIDSEDIVEIRQITGPSDLRGLTQSVYAAAKIVVGQPPLDEFSKLIDTSELIRI